MNCNLKENVDCKDCNYCVEDKAYEMLWCDIHGIACVVDPKYTCEKASKRKE